MENPKDRVIEAAVRPFSENAEAKAAARELLGHVVRDASANPEDPVKRWESIDRTGGRSRRNLLLWITVTIVVGSVFASEFQEIRRLAAWSGWLRFNTFVPPPEEPVQKLAATLNEQDRLLLFGDLSKTDKVEGKEALWRSDPGNPAFFADYASLFISDRGDLPRDFLKTARRIDPDNSWFFYQAAAIEARQSVKSEPRKGKRVAGKIVFEDPRTWKILDQSRFDRTLALLEEASNRQGFRSYVARMLGDRILLIPQETYVDYMESGSCLAAVTTFPSLRLRSVSDVISARIAQLADAGDVTGFKAFAGSAEHLLRGMCGEESAALVDELVLDTVATGLAESLAHASEKLGLEEDALHWNQVMARLKERKDVRKSSEFVVDGKVVRSGMRTGIFLNDSLEIMARQAAKQPSLADSDLEPGRLFDQEFLSRLLSYLLFILLLPCLILVFCHRFVVTPISRRLSLRMDDLLQLSDRAWIVGIGVLLPFCYVMAVNRLTLLGGRDLGVRETMLLMPLAHFLGLWLLWLAVPARVVRWRLSKRVGVFGFGPSSWFDWLAVAAAVAFIPVIGWAASFGSPADFWQTWMEELGFIAERTTMPATFFWIALGCAGLTLLWLAYAVIRTLLNRPERQFRQATTALAQTQAFAWMLILLALAIPVFQANAQHWFEQEKLAKFDPNGPGWSVYGHKVAVQCRKELREILGY